MVPLALRSPEASVLHCHLTVLSPLIAEIGKPKGTSQIQLPASTPSEVSPCYLGFQHHTDLTKVLCRRQREAKVPYLLPQPVGKASLLGASFQVCLVSMAN